MKAAVTKSSVGRFTVDSDSPPPPLATTLPTRHSRPIVSVRTLVWLTPICVKEMHLALLSIFECPLSYHPSLGLLDAVVNGAGGWSSWAQLRPLSYTRPLPLRHVDVTAGVGARTKELPLTAKSRAPGSRPALLGEARAPCQAACRADESSSRPCR